MNPYPLSFVSLAWKTAIVHTVTYFICGAVGFFMFDYATKFADPQYAGVIRSLDHPLVMLGPLFQPIRGLLFALVFYPLRKILFFEPRGWLVLWWMLFALGILNTFGPAPCSIEGSIYSPLPFWDHITGLPETVVQSFLLAGLLFYWVHHTDVRWLNWLLHIAFTFVILLVGLGFWASTH